MNVCNILSSFEKCCDLCSATAQNKRGREGGCCFFLRDGFPEILELFAVFQFSLRWIFHGAGETIAY